MIAIAYLARGADEGWEEAFERFIRSYQHYPPGIPHNLYILFKGFKNTASLKKGMHRFETVLHQAIFLEDDAFDIGAYITWAKQISEPVICPLNTASEILSGNWLYKLYLNLSLPGVGLVGATGSYESLSDLNYNFPAFPNIHIRSNAFMIERELFLDLTKDLLIKTKLDSYFSESGPYSFTSQVLAMGRNALVVGKNGRGYMPNFWDSSDTFRQGTQENLLIGDNQTRHFKALSFSDKCVFFERTWGTKKRVYF